jgi:hypothetical protein
LQGILQAKRVQGNGKWFSFTLCFAVTEKFYLMKFASEVELSDMMYIRLTPAM